MIFSLKELNEKERNICLHTISPKAIFALVGDAIARKQSLSIVRMGDGERKILGTKETQGTFTGFEKAYEGWNAKLGIENMPIDALQSSIIQAGNTCTFFAPSISGISYPEYFLYDFFAERQHYCDNFFVNDWTKNMIQMLLEGSDGVCILHRDYKQIIQDFQNNYQFVTPVSFSGFPKNSWQDNQQAIDSAISSGAQLILFSGGPAGKIIGPAIAQKANVVALDIGNTLIPWSKKDDSLLKL